MKKILKIILGMCLVAQAAQAAQAAPTSGVVSWYGGKFHGRTAADGSTFNKYAMTTASNSHALGTKLRVTNPKNGKSVVVKVTDRGGFGKYGRTLDLSRGAFAKIEDLENGLVDVKIKVLKKGE